MEKGVPVRAVARTLDVLKAVNRHGSLTLTQISRICDLAYATTCRIVQTLVQEGMLERVPGGKTFRPTGLVQMLSYGYQEKNAFAALARPHLAALTRKIGWPCVLCNRVSDSMVITDTTYSLTTMAFSEYHAGFAAPIWGTSSGLAHLAYCPETEYETIVDVVRRDEAGFRKHWLLDMKSLGKTIGEVRARGYATFSRVRHSLNPGKTSAIAIPLFKNDELAATMAIIFFASTHTTEQAAALYLEDLLATQAAIADDEATLDPIAHMPLPAENSLYPNAV